MIVRKRGRRVPSEVGANASRIRQIAVAESPALRPAQKQHAEARILFGVLFVGRERYAFQAFGPEHPEEQTAYWGVQTQTRRQPQQCTRNSRSRGHQEVTGQRQAGRNLAIEISSVQSSNVTARGIPIVTVSGAQPTMFVIIEGPSSSVTNATT